MPIKPSPTIAGKLRKLFNNNKQTIEPAIGDSIPGGSGGGANVLTLYANFSEVRSDESLDFTVYKNADLTEQYTSLEEATNAIGGAGAIAIVLVGSPEGNMRLYPVGSASDNDHASVDAIIEAAGGLTRKMGYLWGASETIH